MHERFSSSLTLLGMGQHGTGTQPTLITRRRISPTTAPSRLSSACIRLSFGTQPQRFSTRLAQSISCSSTSLPTQTFPSACKQCDGVLAMLTVKLYPTARIDCCSYDILMIEAQIMRPMPHLILMRTQTKTHSTYSPDSPSPTPFRPRRVRGPILICVDSTVIESK